uniref:CaM kinase-like vesicle-associated protein n=1 Tax=Sinocyclocheilus grahami TaxID=75366 RepID=A0A672JYL3_SINGR
MPFGCLKPGEKKDYNSPTEITDKYDLGQTVKSEEFCEIFRAKDKNTLKMYTCKKFLKKDGRKVRKAAKNEILILKMVKHPNILQLVDVYETRKEYYLFLELVFEIFHYVNLMGIIDPCFCSFHKICTMIKKSQYYANFMCKMHVSELCGHESTITQTLLTVSNDFPHLMHRLSGNPPFYDETDDDDYENHDKNLFRKILAGDYEFDSPYWDEISDSAKNLVSRLMEVDQDQRLTAQEAINHEWISGNAASDKNIKENVCAQIEKNFAKAKWKKAVRVTTMMKRLRAPEHQTAAAVPGAPNPAAGAQENPQAPSEASTAPSSTAESNSTSTEAPAVEAPSAEAMAATDQPPVEPVLHAPAPEQPDPTSRCNGEALAPLPSDTGEEQMG